MREIKIISKNDKNKARQYFNNYLKELAQYDASIVFDDNGEPVYKWFDLYWEEKDRFPLFLEVDGQVAGIALIRKIASRRYEIAEFYVKTEFRKDGNAMWFARQITKMFEGEFVFSTLLNNTSAVKFWDKFSAKFKEKKSFVKENRKNWEIIIK